MDRIAEERPPVPLIHGRMIYCCGDCGKSWPMYLEKGIEEFGENHKPSPLFIGCPYCGGWAMDVSGIQKVSSGGYVPLPDGYSYFANREDRDCGESVFFASEHEADEKETGAVIADVLDRLKSWEMEMCREAMHEEQARMEEIINKVMPGEVVEEAFAMVLKVLWDFADSVKAMFVQLEPGEFLNIPTARDRKRVRKKQKAVERAAVSRFRQYKARENGWIAQKRTGLRSREWRGP